MPNDDNNPNNHWDEVKAVQRYERELQARDNLQTLKPQRGQDNANLIYILYLVNFAVPFLGIVGVIMAYSGRDHADDALASHYENQIRIFWTTVIAYIISFILMFVIIGFFLIMLVFVWKVVRVATGMSLLSRGLPVRNVGSLSFTSD